MSESKTPERLFYSRSEACHLLGGISLPILKEFEDHGKLTPLRLSGRKQGRVYFEHAELMSLRDALVPKAKAKIKRRPISKAA